MNSYIGLLSDLSPDESRNLELIRIQDRLFTLGALLATENEASKKRLPSITFEDISFLEASIDRMEASLDPIKTFVELDCFYQFNPNLTDLSSNAVNSQVISVITSYFNTYMVGPPPSTRRLVRTPYAAVNVECRLFLVRRVL